MLVADTVPVMDCLALPFTATLAGLNRKLMPGGKLHIAQGEHTTGAQARVAAGPSNALKAGIVFFALAGLLLLARWHVPQRKAALL